MKIVFNTGQVYLHGGIEKSLTEKANYYANMPGVEVFIVTIEQNDKKPCYKLDEAVQIIDLKVNYDRQKSYFSFENLRKAIIHFYKRRKTFSKLKPNVVISPNFN